VWFPGYYNQVQGQSPEPSPETSQDMQVQVTGTAGISWRKKPVNVSGAEPQPERERDVSTDHVVNAVTLNGRRTCVCVSLPQNAVIPKEKTKKKKFDGKYKKDKAKEQVESWVLFCDFHEITHIVIKDATATIYRQDNKRLVSTDAELILNASQTLMW